MYRLDRVQLAVEPTDTVEFAVGLGSSLGWGKPTVFKCGRVFCVWVIFLW